MTLQGQVSAADLKRLERACRYALEHKLVPLELDIERVTSIDDPARFYLERLRARGARIRQEPATPDGVGQGEVEKSE